MTARERNMGNCHPSKTNVKLGCVSVDIGFLLVTISRVTLSCSQYIESKRLNSQLSLFKHQIAMCLKCYEVVSVSSCPTTEKEWRKAELRVNCSHHECPRGDYHCVPDQEGNLVEVCTEPILLPGKSAFKITFLIIQKTH